MLITMMVQYIDVYMQVSYAEHARWALRYADRRFRLDVQFIFQVFGVLQKRQVCTASCLQIKKADFHRNERAIQNINASALLQSSKEEMEKKPISNPAVKFLKRHLLAVRTKVMGTDESRRCNGFLLLTVDVLTSYVSYPFFDLGNDNTEVSSFLVDNH